ncbi:HAMP domain-containing sensor histidine kinase [Collinsella sp. An2]|uniref:HAMP domain-containing sensor histidine kinase n=1 Tax=Collinsella sp. An2 TaxID=1965585 RepID=UPI001302A9E7|nr:HAMP domain-containing sensor histidine kinase [Collinsella sp. An2]
MSARRDNEATGRVESSLIDRVRTWWSGLPLMRAFFCYSVIWLVVSAFVMFVLMEAFMQAYDAAMYSAGDGVEVDSGPYVYDAADGELVPAVSIDMGGEFDRSVFLGMRGGTGRATESGEGFSQETYNASNGLRVVYATMDMVRDDPALTILDWGGNYTEADYIAADGNPYDPEPIAPNDLAAYDARERAARVPVSAAIDGVDENSPDLVVSNVAYYVSKSMTVENEPLVFGLRLAAVILPFVGCGILAVVLFRRFYLKRLSAPLATLHGAADRIAAQNLDFTVGAVQGREFGRLAEAFEHMRSSLAHAQADLWRTAEDRRRLNAAFAHDLRTPVTVLKGTLEMARLRAERAGSASADSGVSPGADSAGCSPAEASVPDGAAANACDVQLPRETLDALSAQVRRLEDYAQSMSKVTKLEDRPVRREVCAARELVDDLRHQVTEMAASCGREVEVDVTLGKLPSVWCDSGSSDVRLLLDRQLIEEVVGNLMSNACGHARGKVRLDIDVELDAQNTSHASHAAVVSGEVAGEAGDKGNASAPLRGTLRVVVADDGPGFTGEALHRGCDPFYSEAKSAEHFGLGLNIARTLARLHGGDVELANGPAGGAVVTATFAVGDDASDHAAEQV